MQKRGRWKPLAYLSIPKRTAANKTITEGLTPPSIGSRKSDNVGMLLFRLPSPRVSCLQCLTYTYTPTTTTTTTIFIIPPFSSLNRFCWSTTLISKFDKYQDVSKWQETDFIWCVDIFWGLAFLTNGSPKHKNKW